MNATDHRAMVLFDKQVEFFDKLMPVLHNVNCYITTLEVWSGETGKTAGKQLKNTLKKDACFKALQELLDQYYIYIPEDVSSKADQLQLHCLMLQNTQLQDATAGCIDLLFGLQNDIRKYIQHLARRERV